MKILITFLICGVFGEVPVTTVLPKLEPETLTDLPMKDIAEFEAGVTMKPRQNDVDYEIKVDEIEVISEENSSEPSSTVSTTTLHFTQMACTGEHMEWNTCGPRCYQTCAFQPRGSRQSRAICESASTTNCYPGCFCASGYVRLNEKCVLPVDCPSK
jgi:hypothetical protein